MHFVFALRARCTYPGRLNPDGTLSSSSAAAASHGMSASACSTSQPSSAQHCAATTPIILYQPSSHRNITVVPFVAILLYTKTQRKKNDPTYFKINWFARFSWNNKQPFRPSCQCSLHDANSSSSAASRCSIRAEVPNGKDCAHKQR